MRRLYGYVASELPFLLPVVLQAPGVKIYICTMAK